jgi:hypothetical protein
MNSLDEGKAKAVHILKSNGYEIDEHGETLLASMYCDREPGGAMCLLLEVKPPYNKCRPWGGIPYSSEDIIGKLVNSLNEKLNSMKTSSLDIHR